MSKQVPATPDYVGAAQQTAQSSADTTEAQTVANRPNINTPWSQQTWQATPTFDPTTGTYVNQWTQNTNLAQPLQNSLNNQFQTQENVSGNAATMSGQQNTSPLDWSHFQALGTAPQAQTYNNPALLNSIDMSGVNKVDNSNTYANNAANAAYQQYTNRNQPLQQQALTALQNQLTNQGLRPGDAAYDTAVRNLQNQQSDANTQADLGATQFGIQGGQIMQGEDLARNQNAFNQAGTAATFYNSAAQSALQNQLATGAQTFGQQLSSSNYQDQMRQQQIAEDMQNRGFTTNEINAMLTGQQVGMPSQPGFNASAAAQPTNYSGAVGSTYGANLNAANLANSQSANTAGDAIGIAAMFF